MAELKTKQTDDSVAAFINSVDDVQKRKDSFEIVEIMKQATGLQPKMWGTSIIGFGSYHYKYESGHEGDMCLIGFSPRKQNIALYVGVNNGNIPELLQKLGKHKTGKGCLYINKFSDVNADILKQIIKASFNEAKAKHS
jgi:uncharacterized protein DUF1801